jgi:hypothetical protein
MPTKSSVDVIILAEKAGLPRRLHVLRASRPVPGDNRIDKELNEEALRRHCR